MMAGTETFNSIYTAYYRRSFMYVKSYVHDDMTAEDIVSDSLIRLWGKLKTDNNLPVAPYLFAILRNAALDYLKHEKIRLSALADINDQKVRELEIRLSTLTASDPEIVFSGEVLRIIHTTLAKLPEKTRVIFEMSRFEGMPYKEIAELQKISVKGVDYHILQAMSELKVALKDYLPAWFLLINSF
jgi:RNA polymerase sigma-70 factor, ECF subfamily